MKKILLVCAAGMSTGVLVNKMKTEAELKKIEVDIEALPVAEAANVIDCKDVVLLGPQVRYNLKQVEEMAGGRIPVAVINMTDYGTMNGKKVLHQALDLIGLE